MCLSMYMGTFIINACTKNSEVPCVKLSPGIMLYNDSTNVYSLCFLQVTMWPIFYRTMVFYIASKIKSLQISSICFIIVFYSSS